MLMASSVCTLYRSLWWSVPLRDVCVRVYLYVCHHRRVG